MRFTCVSYSDHEWYKKKKKKWHVFIIVRNLDILKVLSIEKHYLTYWHFVGRLRTGCFDETSVRDEKWKKKKILLPDDSFEMYFVLYNY